MRVVQRNSFIVGVLTFLLSTFSLENDILFDLH